jgi:hypothetical protein
MNLKIKALINTCKLVLLGIAFYAIGYEISHSFTTEQLSVGISGIGILFLLYLVYDLKLSQLKYEEQLNKTVDKLKD